MVIVKRDFYGRELSIEVGRVAKQAGGAALVRCGDSVVLVTACCGPKKVGDFLPLTIDYVQKDYATGRIPGGYFRREGKLSEREILVSRLIDRPCRPLFPEGFTNEIQVIATVLSADEDNDTDVLAVLGASAALTVSEMPFEGPIAAVHVARIGGKLTINPFIGKYEQADLNFVVAGTREAIVMVEGEAKEVLEKDVTEALFFAHQELQVLIQMQVELREKIGKAKMVPDLNKVDQDVAAKVRSIVTEKVKKAIRTKEKAARRELLGTIKQEAEKAVVSEGMSDADKLKVVAALNNTFELVMYETMREMVLSEKVRIDGRDTKTIRPISCDVGLLPRVHGSAMFTRGETQAIVATTLGTMQDAQRLNTVLGEQNKAFMLHYNFPPFSTGETKPNRGPGRREIGHGFLAERAIKAVLPDEKSFPYAIRIVSEITESNGSSSMASVCGGILSLMDAGVPVRTPVAGVAMGLIKEGERFAVLSDILGDEDHLGDMDFKVCGSEKGITAIQMDIKVKGLSRQIMSDALDQAREGRLHILGKMHDALSSPRAELSQHAPRITSIKIHQDKIRDLIGPGGKTIRGIQESTGVKIEVLEDGTVNVSSTDRQKSAAAMEIIKSITAQAEVGKLYKGVVKRIADFGAFVEILPGTDGLLHISQIADTRIERVSDVMSEGDEVWVKVLDVDRQGKIRLSKREADADMREGRIAG